MKRTVSIILLLVVIGVATAIAATPVGTYVNKDNSGEYIVLKPDGQFHLRESRKDYYGKYFVKGNEIVFLFKSGFGFAGTIRGGKIIDENGIVWVKQ